MDQSPRNSDSRLSRPRPAEGTGMWGVPSAKARGDSRVCEAGGNERGPTSADGPTGTRVSFGFGFADIAPSSPMGSRPVASKVAQILGVNSLNAADVRQKLG